VIEFQLSGFNVVEQDIQATVDVSVFKILFVGKERPKEILFDEFLIASL
jgi:hypothetical protein